MVQAISQANAFQSPDGFGFVRDAMKILREHHVFHRRQIRHQVKLLENEADFVGAVASQFAFAERAHVDAIDDGAPAGGPVEATQNVDQGRFAGAGGAHDGDPFASGDLKTHAIERAQDAEGLRDQFGLHYEIFTGSVIYSPRRISAGRTRPSRRSGNAPASDTATISTR